MPHPKITIVTPSFNQANFLEGTILSILGQNYPNLEYFVIDGLSKDNSVDIIKKYENNIDYWISEPDNGQSEAINKGLKRATGDIITWINSDDQIIPGTLEKVAHYFKNNSEIDLIHGKTILTTNKGDLPFNSSRSAGYPYSYLSGMSFSQPSTYFKRRVLEQQGMLSEDLHYGLDYDLFVRIALNYNILETKDYFSKYLLHEKSKTSTASTKFANEWAGIFSKVLRSFSITNDLINEMRFLNLYHEGEDTYVVSKEFGEAFLRKSFLYFLYFQVVFYYDALELEQVRKLTRFIKNFDKKFLKMNNLVPVYWRSRLINKSIAEIARKFRK